MRHIILFAIVGFFMCLTSCRDDFEFEQSPGGLEFSRDTVYLDTVFSDIGSSTYTLKVYNRSDKDIAIPSLRLKKGQTSNYRLMVDGMSGKEFNNVELLAKDSLFIFIETTANIGEANPTDFLYTDEIEFHSMNGVQEVHLVTLIQDAYFLFPQRDITGPEPLYEAVRFNSDDSPEAQLVYGFNLDEADPVNGNEYHWNNTKPYVIYGLATVPNGKTLVVDPGARIHFHAGAGLMVRPGATLQVNGVQSTNEETLEGEVIFEGDRLEPRFGETPGQWGAVLIMSATDNTISHLTLKNSALGIWAKAPEGDEATVPKVNIRESQIYNSGNFGILSVHANITAQNLVVNKAGNAAVALRQGGTHNFTHCTIANYSNAYNQFPLVLSDYFETETEIRLSSIDATFTNCIFWSSGNLGIKHEKLPNNNTGTTYTFKFNNCLIKLYDYSNTLATNSLYPFANTTDYTFCKVAKSTSSGEPRVNFTDPQKNILTLEENSGAIDMGTTTPVATDINGNGRISLPDAGAYEYGN
ncbi:MAG: choice-of-anchor Q domain-containing protein [Flavobacterium sp.]